MGNGGDYELYGMLINVALGIKMCYGAKFCLN